MVLAIADNDVAVGLDSDAFETLELTVGRPPTAERLHEDTFSVENLDAVVTWIGHDDVALVIYRYPSAYPS